MRWLAAPWRDVLLTAALIASASTPSFMAAAGTAWTGAAGDRVTEQLVAKLSASEAGLVIKSSALFANDAFLAADRAITTALADIPGLDRPTPSIYTFRGVLVHDGATVPISVRALARPGAVEALDRTSGAGADGVWISDWLAERAGIGEGAMISFEAGAEPEQAGADVVPGRGNGVELTVAGVYSRLWNEDNTRQEGYWREVAPDLLPTFVGPFNEPSFELLVMSPELLLSSGLVGEVRWDAPLAKSPVTFNGLSDLVSRYRSIESAIVRGASVAPELRQLSPHRPPASVVVTRATETLVEANSAKLGLRGPLETTRAAGIGLGLVLAVATGSFFVRRRYLEFRLLGAEGERWLIMSLRAAGQLAPHHLIGAPVGSALGVFAASQWGPALEYDLEGIDFGVIGRLALLGLTVMALSVGLSGQRAAEGRSRVSSPRNVLAASGAVLTLASAFVWLQTRRPTSTRPTTIDLEVLVLPWLIIAAVAVSVLLLIDVVAARARLRESRLRPATFLALRRLLTPESGSRIIILAMSLGLGSLLFTVSIVASLDHLVDLKLATEIGGSTQVDLLGIPPPGLPPPPDSTYVYVQDTRTRPGDAQVRVVAVDPTTLAAGVEWPEGFGLPIEELTALLEQNLGNELAAVAIDGQALPEEGAFGSSQTFPYRLVGRSASLTLASESRPTLMVSAIQLDRLAASLAAQALGLEPDDPDLSSLRPPTSTFRRRLVSQLPPDALAGHLEELGLRERSVVTLGSRLSDPDILIPRFAFGYMRLLSWVAMVASLVALFVYRSAQADRRAVSLVMLLRMGMTKRAAIRSARLEMVGLVLLSGAIGGSVAPWVTAHLLARFDPVPSLPPAGRVLVPVVQIGLGAGLGLVAVAILAGLIEARSAARSPVEVQRGIV